MSRLIVRLARIGLVVFAALGFVAMAAVAAYLVP